MRIEATRERKKNTQILFYEAFVRHSMKKNVTIERRERANDERTKNKS